MRSGGRRTDLWARASGDVCPGRRHVYDLNFNGREGAEKVTYGDVFLQSEQEYSRYNFEIADTAMLLKHFEDAEKECEAILKAGAPAETGALHKCVLPAYDQCIKASHVFNLLDARGVISVTERQGYILRVRNLSRQCGEAFLLTDAGGANYAENTPVCYSPVREDDTGEAR
jgi:glycyl-tRNA synthetase alpha chain